ncbi:MAG: acetamidase/formamidase family protein [Planctomycetota bacterium]
MKKITRDQARMFAFDWRDEPRLRVAAGEEFEVETWDAGSGYFRTEADLAIPSKRPGFDRNPPLANPVGGPVFVEGAEPGDTLVVDILSMELEATSWTAAGPGRGPLGNSTRWPGLSGGYTTRILRHEPGPDGSRGKGTVRLNDRFAWPAKPFVGTLGVAPEREVLTTLDGQGLWGGNLDIDLACPGNRIFLPVYHPGALFYLGDTHASQGDTEFSGTAAESQACVRLSLNLIKGWKTPGIRIETPDRIVAVRVDRPLEAAVQGATEDLMAWLESEYSVGQADAYCLVSTCPDFVVRIHQMCRIGKLSYVASASLSRALLLGR